LRIPLRKQKKQPHNKISFADNLSDNMKNALKFKQLNSIILQLAAMSRIALIRGIAVKK
jgi:hypothetical protein